MPHEEYVKVFRTEEEVAAKSVRRFQSKKHIVHTIKQTKWALSVTDNKRAWIEINYSLPFGHYKINNEDDDDDDDATTTLSEQSISYLDVNNVDEDVVDDVDQPVCKRRRLFSSSWSFLENMS